jgi:hypothetical protein
MPGCSWSPGWNEPSLVLSKNTITVRLLGTNVAVLTIVLVLRMALVRVRRMILVTVLRAVEAEGKGSVEALG